MKFFEYKDEYVILTEKQKRIFYNFKSSIKNKFYNIKNKILLLFLFFALKAAIFLLNIINIFKSTNFVFYINQ